MAHLLSKKGEGSSMLNPGDIQSSNGEISLEGIFPMLIGKIVMLKSFAGFSVGPMLSCHPQDIVNVIISIVV
jgi:hypothetical protein